MHITDVETIPVEIPVKSVEEPWGIAPYIGGNRLYDVPTDLTYEAALDRVDTGTTSGRKLLIRLETDDGVTGWGEMKVPSMAVGAVVVEELLAPELLGRSVAEPAGFIDAFQTMASTDYLDPRPLLGGAEMAMWDAHGKTLGVPVHQLLGGKIRDRYPIAFCLGLERPAQASEHAAFAADQGFTTVKTKASRYWQMDVERIVAMDEATDGALTFRLDPNQQWDITQATNVAAALDRAGIRLGYLEQPIRVDSFGHLAALRTRCTQPIAINEDAYFAHHVLAAIEHDAIDAAVVDLVPAGGILALTEVAAVAADANIPLAHHSNFDFGIKNAAKLHVLASRPAFSLPMDSVYYAFEDYLLADPLSIERGHFVVPDRPGLAGAVDEDQVERYRLD